jgi:squid
VYGEIESINVKTDPNTGRSRGFAFIVYGSADSIDKVVAAGDHIINNKKVDPKKAKARHGKIFVGGLTTEITDDEIKTYFGQFGNVSLFIYIFFKVCTFNFLFPPFS